MRVEDVKKVTVFGTGLMGHGIAQAFAEGGYPVALYDISSDRLQEAVANIKRNLDFFVEKELLTEAEAAATVGRLTSHSSMADAVRDADFVMEVVSERLELKCEVLRDLDAMCPQRTVLASNTSGLSVNTFGPASGRADRVITAHFWNPPHILGLVEVVKGDATSLETTELTMGLLRKIGKTPVLLKRDIPGFIGNRLQYAMFREAVGLVQMGVASPEDIDLVVKTSLGRRYTTVGPLETSDINGLDLFYQIAQYLYPDLDRATEPHLVHAERIERGHIGVRSGRGFHDWPGERAAEMIRQRDEELIRWLRIDRARARDSVQK